jgi:hypothetical protein
MTAAGQPESLRDRLPAISDAWFAWFRPLWLLTFAFAVLADIGGTAYVLHDTYENDPVFAAIGLTNHIEYDGSVTLGPPLGRESSGQGVEEGSRIVSVDGVPVPPGIGVDGMVNRLRAAPGPTVRIRVRTPEGRLADHVLTRSPVHAREAARGAYLSRDVRMGVRLVFSALGCLTLLVCAVMLFIRRPRDPVALLLSFAFLGMAATIDPPLMMWLALKLVRFYDVISSAWWLLLVTALSVFPDGRFVPRWLRWVPLASAPLTIPLASEAVDTNLQVAIGVGIPLALLLMQPLRYRRLAPGIERQQIKWAAFGFAAGLILIAVSLGLTNVLPPDGTPQRAVFSLFVVCLFSLGFVLMPLGLMVSLIRYRLWEADTVISRSAAYAIVTVIVGIVWAASSDMVKLVVSAVMGEQNVTVATTVSAMLAAGVFAPTQSVVLGWTKRHFGKDAERLKSLASRLAIWRTTETAPEIGMRALAVVAESIHADSAAILALTPTGRELVAARDLEHPEALERPGALDEVERTFPLSLPLEDADGPVGTLLIGPRSDGNRYNRDEREGLLDLCPPLAEAIRAARSREQWQDGIHRTIITAVEERLSRLEAGLGPKPKPA